MEIPRPKSLAFAMKSSLSLFKVNYAVDVFKTTYEAIANSNQVEPLNREDEIFPTLLEIAQQRNALWSPGQVLYPYWMPEKKYDVVEVFGTLVQFIDYHDSDIPTTTFPPENDLIKYINTIMSKDGRVTISQQFEELLNITQNDLLGAVHLGFMASRVMARGLDTRAYPNIHVQEGEMLNWNEKIAQFETHNADRSDGPGDTYYFWTHMFGALFYRLYKGMGRRTYDFSFQHGTDIMKFVRIFFARSPINSSHYEASLLGRNIGLAFGYLMENPD